MQTVDLKAYWDKVAPFSQYPEDKRADGYALGLLAEAGEVCGVIDKWLRNKYDEAEMKRRLVDELSDVCWYAVALLSTVDALEDDFEVFPEKAFDAYDLHAWAAVELMGNALKTHFEILVGPNPESLARKLLSTCASISGFCDTTLQAVLDANVAKLTERHGNGGVK